MDFFDVFIFFVLPFSIIIVALIGVVFHERAGRELDRKIAAFAEKERRQHLEK